MSGACGMPKERKQSGVGWSSALVLFAIACAPAAGRHEATRAAPSVAPTVSAARETLSYRPSSARGLDAIQKSPLALGASELELLERNGFVLSTRAPGRTFAAAYAQIYRTDLPVYVSADSILVALQARWPRTPVTILRT
jgi:Protein of unknown function (DUF3160)